MNVDYLVWFRLRALQLIQHLLFFHHDATNVLVQHHCELLEVIVEVNFGQVLDSDSKIGHLHILLVNKAIFAQDELPKEPARNDEHKANHHVKIEGYHCQARPINCTPRRLDILNFAKGRYDELMVFDGA